MAKSVVPVTPPAVLILSLALSLLGCGRISFEVPLVSQGLAREGLTVESFGQAADPTGRLGVDDVRAGRAGEWLQHKRAYPTFGYTSATHWFRIRLTNAGEREVPAILRVGFEHIDRLKLYAYRDGERYDERASGREQPFATREFPHRRFAFALNVPPGESVVFLSARSRHALNVPIRLLTPQEYQEAWGKEQIRMGVYFGIILLLFFLNCLFYYAFRDAHFPYYLLYVFATAFTQITVQGYGFKFLWPDSPGWNAVSLTVLTCLFGITVVLFCKRFLGLAIHLPGTNRFLDGCILLLLLTIGTLWFLPLGVTESIVNFWILAGSLICISCAVRMAFLGNEAARYYLVGWSLFFSLGLVYLFQNVGLVPNGFFFGIDMYEFLLLGVLAEVLFFPVAIVVRIRTIIREHREKGESVSPERPSRLTRLDLRALRERLYRVMAAGAYRKDITLGKLARFVGISEKDLSEFLNEEEHKSYYNFVNEFRVREACRLLTTQPDLKILEIAQSVGFQSLSTFNNAFLKLQGMSPRDFRKAGAEPA